MTSTVQYVTVEVPHQPKKAFRREIEENPDAKEPNWERVQRELKSLQDRLSNYFLQYRDERERHRLNLLSNLYQQDIYWFEWDCFDERMFRFRCAWMNHLVNETIEQLWGFTSGILKDLWGMECEVDIRGVIAPKKPLFVVVSNNEYNTNIPVHKQSSARTFQARGGVLLQATNKNCELTKTVRTKTMDVVAKRSYYLESSGDPTGEYIMQTMIALKMELDKLESVVAKKREAHRRILLKDLKTIRDNLKLEKVNNGVNILIEHFNSKVVHSMKTIHEYHQKSIDDYMKLLKDVEYICNELMDRLILDTSMSEYEKSILGKELNQFRQDAKSHIQEVDNFNYELRELSRGTNLKKLRGLTKDEYKSRIHDIITFIENAEVPLSVFKAVGFDLHKNEEISDNSSLSNENVDAYGPSGPLEKDYPDETEE